MPVVDRALRAAQERQVTAGGVEAVGLEADEQRRGPDDEDDDEDDDSGGAKLRCSSVRAHAHALTLALASARVGMTSPQALHVRLAMAAS